MSKKYERLIAVFDEYIDAFDEQSDKLIIILGNDKTWINKMKALCGDTDRIVSISDTDELKAFIRYNGYSKLVIDINTADCESIVVAEQITLKSYPKDLIFMGDKMPNEDDLERIKNLKGVFVFKDKAKEHILGSELAHGN